MHCERDPLLFIRSTKQFCKQALYLHSWISLCLMTVAHLKQKNVHTLSSVRSVITLNSNQRHTDLCMFTVHTRNWLSLKHDCLKLCSWRSVATGRFSATVGFGYSMPPSISGSRSSTPVAIITDDEKRRREAAPPGAVTSSEERSMSTVCNVSNTVLNAAQALVIVFLKCNFYKRTASASNVSLYCYVYWHNA